MIKLFRLITSRRFYAGIVCMGFVVFGLTKMDVMSFKRKPAIAVSTSLKIGEQGLAPRKKIQDGAIALTYANIKLGNNGSDALISSSTSIGSPEGDDVSKALFFTNSLQSIFKTDIISLINRADDKSTIMQTFLNQGETTVRQASITAQQLQSSIARDNANLTSCQGDKVGADARYNQGLVDNNAGLVQDATNKATLANECIARISTSMRSNQGVLDRLGLAITRNQSYLGLLRSNQTTILTHPELINSNTPSSILQLQRDLTIIRGN